MKKVLIKKDITHKHCKDILFEKKQMHQKMKKIRSNLHELSS